jgi:hypothetical protein
MKYFFLQIEPNFKIGRFIDSYRHDHSRRGAEHWEHWGGIGGKQKK